MYSKVVDEYCFAYKSNVPPQIHIFTVHSLTLLVFCALLWLLLLVSGARAQQAAAEPDALLISLSDQSWDIAGHLSLVRDPSQALTLKDLAFGKAAARFVPVAGNLGLGYTQDIAWLKLRLRRQGSWPQQMALNFLPVFIDYLHVYVPRIAQPASADDFAVLVRGDYVPQAQPEQFQFSLVVPLDLPDADEATIYMRIDTSSTLALSGSVVTETGLRDSTMGRAILAVVLITLTFSAAIMSLIFGLSAGGRYFFNFTILLLAECSYVVATSGFLSLGHYAPAGALSDLIVGAVVLLLALANLVFIRDQLETRLRFPRFHKVLAAIMIADLATLASMPFGSYPHLVGPIMFMTVAAMVAFVFYGLQLSLRMKKPGLLTAVLLGIVKLAFGATAVGWTTGSRSAFGFVEYSYWVSVCLFTPLMAISMVQKANALDRRRRASFSRQVARLAERSARRLVDVRTAELSAAKDVAELALAAERELQAEQLRFIDVVRHQYQTPLSIIRASIAAIGQTLPTTDAANRDRIARIRAAVRDLVQMLDISLDRNRMEDAAIVAQLRCVPVAGVIADLIAHARMMHPRRSIRLQNISLGTGTEAAVDTVMLGLAMTNLIDNAVKFSAPASDIKVICRHRCGVIVIDVVNQGLPIPHAERKDIGKRYFRASNAGPFPGTGLGLHIVSTIAKAHRGRFRISNHSAGGVNARLILPVLRQQPPLV
jgi:two-component system, sensor histidine kinase LadS